MQEPLLSIDDVATRLNVRARWVLAAFRDGLIPAFKVGKEWRCTEEAVENYIKLRMERRVDVI